MYANLRVTAGSEIVHAWKVEVQGDGSTMVYLDDPDDEGSRVVPMGRKVYHGPIKIEADF